MGETSDFELTTFIPSLRDCLHTTNSFGKEFVVSWVSKGRLDKGNDVVVGYRTLKVLWDGLMEELIRIERINGWIDNGWVDERMH